MTNNTKHITKEVVINIWLIIISVGVSIMITGLFMSLHRGGMLYYSLLEKWLLLTIGSSLAIAVNRYMIYDICIKADADDFEE